MSPLSSVLSFCPDLLSFDFDCVLDVDCVVICIHFYVLLTIPYTSYGYSINAHVRDLTLWVGIVTYVHNVAIV